MTTDFEQHIQDTRGYLISMSMNLTRDPHKAEDLRAETVAKAWAGYGRYKQGTEFRRWVSRIMLNTYRDMYVYDKRRPFYNDTDMTEPSYEVEAAVTVASAEDTFLSANIAPPVRRALVGLPQGFAAAVWLHDVDGYTHKEIARMTGVDPGTSMSRAHRGRERLRVELAGYAAEQGIVYRQKT